MNITVSERPGVYTGYEASSIVASTAANGTVGVVCPAAIAEPRRFASAAAARQALGAGSSAAKYVELALSGGAAACVISPAAVEEGETVPTAASYAAGAKVLCDMEVAVICCDSADTDAILSVKAEVAAAAEERKERIAVFSIPGGVDELVALAQSINCERAVVVGPAPAGADGSPVDPVELAVATAAAVCSLGDPAMPLGGATLKGIYGSGGSLTSAEVDLLVRGGVTPVECMAGAVQVVRGVTSRTRTGGEPDATWRELSTVLIVDDVMRTLRSSLGAKFARAKNLPETREAVASQVTIELSRKKAANIIADFGSVSATAAAGDPTRCDVEFEFAVAHGLDRIVVAAHILV